MTLKVRKNLLYISDVKIVFDAAGNIFIRNQNSLSYILKVCITFIIWFSHLCLHKEPPQNLVCTEKKGFFFVPLRLPQRIRNQGKVGQKIEKWTLYSFIVVGIVATSIEISDLYLELRCEKHLMNLA